MPSAWVEKLISQFIFHDSNNFHHSYSRLSHFLTFHKAQALFLARESVTSAGNKLFEKTCT